MSTEGKRVIYVGPADGGTSSPLTVEGKAISAIAAGTIVEQAAGGIQINTNAHTVFGQQFLVADKDQQRSKSVDDSWTINENMVAIAPRSGEFLNVLMATGQAVTSAGMPLTRNGAGLLKLAATNGNDDIIAYSDEIVTTSATTLVRVRVA